MPHSHPSPDEVVFDWAAKLMAVALVITLVLVVGAGLAWLADRQRPPTCTVHLYPDHSWTADGARNTSLRGCALLVTP